MYRVEAFSYFLDIFLKISPESQKHRLQLPQASTIKRKPRNVGDLIDQMFYNVPKIERESYDGICGEMEWTKREELSIEEHGNKVAFKVHQGGYIYCWDGKVGISGHCKEGELFDVIKVGKIRIQIPPRKFLERLERSYRCADHCQAGEHFVLTVVKKGDKKKLIKNGKKVALQSHQGAFLSSWDSKTNTAGHLKGGETFNLVDCGNGKFALKTYQGCYVNAWEELSDVLTI